MWRLYGVPVSARTIWTFWPLAVATVCKSIIVTSLDEMNAGKKIAAASQKGVIWPR
jgi:hypothetical protein